MGEDCSNVVFEIIRRHYTLRRLDISRNVQLSHKIDVIFRALSDNEVMEDVNLAMIPVDKNLDIAKLKTFLKSNGQLLHIDLSGMFESVEHVKGIVKSIKKSKNLLAIHLDNAPIIR